MADCIRGRDKCPHLHRSSTKGETLPTAKGKDKVLDQFCFYCRVSPGVRKIGSIASWAGATPKWCPLNQEEEKRMGWQDAKARAEHRKMELEKQEHQKRVCMGRAMIPVLAAATMIGCMIVGLVAPVVALPWATVNCCCAAVRLDRFARLSRKGAAV